MPASYPSAIKTFTTKTDNVDDVLASHINDPQLEITAIETELGTTPKNTSASVYERIKALRSLASAPNDVIQIDNNGLVGIGLTPGGTKLNISSDDPLRLTSSSDATNRYGFHILSSPARLVLREDYADAELLTFTQGGSIYTTDWYEYGGSVVGFGSYYTGPYRYTMRIGKLVFVAFGMYGVSNSTQLTIQLPWTASGTPYYFSTMGQAMNNAVTGRAQMAISSAAPTIITAVWGDGSSWTATGDKAIWGQMFYYKA